MKVLTVFLAISTVLIYVFTLLAVYGFGFNWPAVAVHDLLSFNWRSQFNFDFIVHLVMLATWVVWREGANARAYLFGFLSIFLGGMFSFPYIAYVSIKAKFNVKSIVLGVHANERRRY